VPNASTRWWSRLTHTVSKASRTNHDANFNARSDLPPSFDPDFYMADKPFLSSREAAFEHFTGVGKRDGLKGSPCCDGGHFLRFINDFPSDSILEIGPGATPRMRGDKVKFADVKSRRELQQRYRNDPAYESIPEKINYVLEGGNLRAIPEKFDIVFSSHVIEHTLDLIEHINSVEAILRNNGLYFLMIPDKRFTFDRFKPVTIVEDALWQHFQNQGRASMRPILLEKCRRAHNDPARHWRGDHGAMAYTKQDVLETIENFERAADDYVNITGYHSWFFTSDSFVCLMNSLLDLDLISLRVYECYNTPRGGMTFSAIMGR
jgi:SAM-dependent methyltransferase